MPSSSTSSACRTRPRRAPARPTPTRSCRWRRPTVPRVSPWCSTSRSPNVAFADFLAGSSGYIESPTAAAGGLNFKTNGVGTGPFKFGEYIAGERTVLEKWDKYWQKDENGIQLPYLDKLTVVPIPDAGQRVTALETGEIDMFQTAASDTVKQAEDRGFAAQKISGSSSTILLFNNVQAAVRRRQGSPGRGLRDRQGPDQRAGLRRRPRAELLRLRHSTRRTTTRTPRRRSTTRRRQPSSSRSSGGLEFTLVCIPTPGGRRDPQHHQGPR